MAQKVHARPERVVVFRIPAFDRVSAFIPFVTFIGWKQDRVFMKQIGERPDWLFWTACRRMKVVTDSTCGWPPDFTIRPETRLKLWN